MVSHWFVACTDLLIWSAGALLIPEEIAMALEFIMGLLGPTRTSLRPVFHWKYSGIFIPLFFATGVAMALSNKFAMAYAFFALLGIWSVGYWLTSDLWQRRDVFSMRER